MFDRRMSDSDISSHSGSNPGSDIGRYVTPRKQVLPSGESRIVMPTAAEDTLEVYYDNTFLLNMPFISNVAHYSYHTYLFMKVF